MKTAFLPFRKVCQTPKVYPVIYLIFYSKNKGDISEIYGNIPTNKKDQELILYQFLVLLCDAITKRSVNTECLHLKYEIMRLSININHAI